MCDENTRVAEIDFEAEGLLDGLEGEAREARLALLRDLSEAGVPLEEIKQAVAEGRLVLLPAERVFEPEGERYTRREIAEKAGFELDFLEKLTRALGLPRLDPDEPRQHRRRPRRGDAGQGVPRCGPPGRGAAGDLPDHRHGDVTARDHEP